MDICGQSITGPLCPSFLTLLFTCSNVGSHWLLSVPDLLTCRGVGPPGAAWNIAFGISPWAVWEYLLRV